MKKILFQFIRRGLTSCGLGPIVLAVLYLILEHQGVVHTLTVSQVCIGIFSLTVLAFVAGGINVVYQLERLPLMLAILIHGCALYVAYLGTYLLNDWLESGIIPFLVFTGVFFVGYLLIWVVIYCIVKRNTKKLNEMLKQKQQTEEYKYNLR